MQYGQIVAQIVVVGARTLAIEVDQDQAVPGHRGQSTWNGVDIAVLVSNLIATQVERPRANVE